MQGLVHIYTGNGKGKTTASVGLAVRASGSGKKVLFAQFLKCANSGELSSFDMLKPSITVFQGVEVKKFIWNMNEEEKIFLEKETYKQFINIAELIKSGTWDMVILDEVIGAVTNGFIPVDDVIGAIKDRAHHVEIVLTGRNAPPELIEAADYVSEVNEIKHPMTKGIAARKGIEY